MNHQSAIVVVVKDLGTLACHSIHKSLLSEASLGQECAASHYELRGSRPLLVDIYWSKFLFFDSLFREVEDRNRKVIQTPLFPSRSWLTKSTHPKVHRSKVNLVPQTNLPTVNTPASNFGSTNSLAQSA